MTGNEINKKTKAESKKGTRTGTRKRTWMRDVPYQPPSTVKSNGIEITYDAFGEPSSPGILLIDGLGQQLIDWGEILCRELAAPGFRVIRFDNRDTGLSSIMDRPGKENYTLEDMAEDALGLLDSLSMDSAHVMGFSMGGMIAQLLAIHHPHRVRTLTCISTTTNDPSLPPPSREAAVMLSSPRPMDREGFVDSTVELLAFSFGVGYPFDTEAARDLADTAYRRSFQPDGTARQYTAMVSQESLRSGLMTVNKSVLVIHGDADPFFPVAHGKDIAGCVPDARFIVVPGMGHVIPGLYPARVRERIIGEIRDFLM